MLSWIKLVEIEINSFCNRKCVWCPNTRFRRNKAIKMPYEVYEKIIHELKNCSYKGVISFSRYNEPMSDILQFKNYLQLARDILPDIKLVSNTNGDYLSRENLDGLLLDELSVMDYDCLGMEICLDRLKRLNVEIANVKYPYIFARYENIKLLYYVDWAKNALLVDRGGFLKSEVRHFEHDMKWLNNKELRRKPCFEPMFFIGIDYNGDVVPCCQIRGDNPKHRKFILGNINKSSLIDICSGEKISDFKKSIVNYDFKQYPLPCKYCQKGPGRYTRENPGIEFEEAAL